MTDILMPRLSDTMEEGVVASWSKKVGDEVKKGDVIGEIETDKTTMDLEAYDSGVLEKVLVEAGGTVAIGEPIAVLGDGSGSSDSEADSDESGADESGADQSGADESGDAESDSDKAADADKAAESESGTDDGKSSESKDSESKESDGGQSAEPERGDDSEVRRSPLARRMARDHGIDLSTVTGTGPGGRIIRTDVERAVAEHGSGKHGSEQQAESSPSSPSNGPAGQAVTGDSGDADETVKLTANQRITAERLSANAGAPTFQESITVRVDDLLAFRKTLNERLDGHKVSVNDLFVKACARTLKDHPEINSSWGGDTIIRRGEINVGIAVALNGGLIVPVVKNADRKTLTELSTEARELAGRAKDGKLRPEEFKGGTFSISNLGMYGIDHFTALINPPEAAILAVGAAKEEPYVDAGKLAQRSVITMTMTVDHRVVNGAEAAVFLSDLKSVLESPLTIVV